MKHFIIVLIFLPFLTYGQKKVAVLDSVTNKVLPYATIKMDDNTGVYSNAKGIFELDLKKTNQLEISYLGYVTKSLQSIVVKDSVFLKPKEIELEEISIKPRNQELKDIKFLKKPKGFAVSIVSPEHEIITSIKPKKPIVNYYINEVSFMFKKLKRKKDKNFYKKHKAVLRINIYDVIDNKPNTLIYSSKTLKINAINKDKLVINIEDEFIKFNKNGVAFGVEYIGNIDASGNFYKTNELYLRPGMAKKKKSKFFSAITYHKYSFNNKNKLLKLDSLRNANLPTWITKKFYRNLNISFKLSK